jgi:diaminohydroxyphosphoribosylaminopyrimidine deaminase/5-amino-6-(5-phosphoribosylamino)uracil reductase
MHEIRNATPELCHGEGPMSLDGRPDPKVPGEVTAAAVWDLLRALARGASVGRPLLERAWFGPGRDGRLREVDQARGVLWLDPATAPGFGVRVALAREVEQLISLYLPLCAGSRSPSLCVAHLGQSLDGRIATLSGASRYVTGQENLAHLHRLRALCDAVVVGARTVERDDPQLTTRLVVGDNPVRVVIDPELRSLSERRVFRDGLARTVVVTTRAARARPGEWPAVELVELGDDGGAIAPAAVLSALGALGLSRILVEGGGITVSRFLQARALDRLQLALAPVILGSGLPGLSLPPIASLDEALRPRARRFTLGEDVLFDCEFER